MRLLRWFVIARDAGQSGLRGVALGALRGVGLAPATESDPGRLEQQIRPTAVRILTPQAAAAVIAASASAPAIGPPPPLPAVAPASAADAAASAPPAAASSAAITTAAASGPLACLEIGPLDNAAAVDAAERALTAALTDRGERGERAWVREQRPADAQYAVFVGPVLSREAARQRREELVKLKMSFEGVELPGGKQGGYSLGRHDSEAAAQAALAAFRERGLRNASVVLLRESGSPRTWLRLDNLRLVAADTVRALPATQLGGQAASPCVFGSVMSVTRPQR